MLLTLATVTVCAAEPGRPMDDRLRQCVSTAGGADAVAQCESRHQQWLRERIEVLGSALLKRLDAAERALLERNIAAWEAYYAQEIALTDLALGKRADGLGPRLRPGAVSRLLEQREQQLREHLHSLSF